MPFIRCATQSSAALIPCRFQSLVRPLLRRNHHKRWIGTEQPETVPNTEALHEWMRKAGKERIITHDTLRAEHLENLYITLPTRDGSAEKYIPPVTGDPLGYGHHLVFFHPRNPERRLRADGSDPVFCPPDPFTRRMWAGGRLVWRKHGQHGLCIGDKVSAVSYVKEVKQRGIDEHGVIEHGIIPMVFAKQCIEYRKEGCEEAALEEERTHVYLYKSADKRSPKEVVEHATPDVSLEFTPTGTTLFRFSALTWNGHKIHLDKEFAQLSEGYTERLVHGPLTALMMLETATTRFKGLKPRIFEYRAVNPMIVNRPMEINAAWEAQAGTRGLRMWVAADKKIVMTGKIVL